MAYSPEDTQPIIDNDRVTAWDITWAPSQSGPVRVHHDFVNVYLVGGTIRVIMPDGRSHVERRRAGESSFEPRGSIQRVEVSREPPPRAIVIDLKDRPLKALRNTSGYPDAFPRAGAKKLLENDRVVVWDYTWISAAPTPMHMHDKDSVVVYLEDGALKSVTRDGQAAISENSFGLTKFIARERLHSEELIRGKARAIIVELK